ncbi:DNA-directed RNA polymerase subunit delta [Alteribacillus sp. HJP-4]|uniref:DNA-directed RNA polymerase subunit delta n=1 Tax=Alteribacillus sp. HJP-4 TaxID=2775394 RepID=UPI0035CD1A5F
MSISDFKQEQIEEMSAVELALILLGDEKKPYDYQQLIERITKMKKFTKAERDSRTTKLFTAMNLDGRFVHLGQNHWGLREWYPLDQSDDDLSTTVKKPKKRKKAYDDYDEDFAEEDFDDDLEDVEDELDELSQEEDADDDYEEKDESAVGYDSNEDSSYDDKDEDEDY